MVRNKRGVLSFSVFNFVLDLQKELEKEIVKLGKKGAFRNRHSFICWNCTTKIVHENNND